MKHYKHLHVVFMIWNTLVTHRHAQLHTDFKRLYYTISTTPAKLQIVGIELDFEVI